MSDEKRNARCRLSELLAKYVPLSGSASLLGFSAYVMSPKIIQRWHMFEYLYYRSTNTINPDVVLCQHHESCNLLVHLSELRIVAQIAHLTIYLYMWLG